jgi:hypothetical protein
MCVLIFGDKKSTSQAADKEKKEDAMLLVRT